MTPANPARVRTLLEVPLTVYSRVVLLPNSRTSAVRYSVPSGPSTGSPSAEAELGTKIVFDFPAVSKERSVELPKPLDSR